MASAAALATACLGSAGVGTGGGVGGGGSAKVSARCEHTEPPCAGIQGQCGRAPGHGVGWGKEWSQPGPAAQAKRCPHHSKRRNAPAALPLACSCRIPRRTPPTRTCELEPAAWASACAAAWAEEPPWEVACPQSGRGAGGGTRGSRATGEVSEADRQAAGQAGSRAAGCKAPTRAGPNQPPLCSQEEGGLAADPHAQQHCDGPLACAGSGRHQARQAAGLDRKALGPCNLCYSCLLCKVWD